MTSFFLLLLLLLLLPSLIYSVSLTDNSRQEKFKASLPSRFCDGNLDVMLLQDTTHTFLDEHSKVSRQLSSIVEEVTAMFPGSRFGIADFKDKPIDPFGIPDQDYCYKLHQSLTSDIEALKAAEDRLSISGGGDYPEAHYEAIFDTLADINVGWRYTDRKKMIHNGGHIIVLITDAEPHIPGHFSSNGLPTHPDFPNVGNHTDLCNNFDYPSPQQILSAISATRTNMIFLLNDVYPIAARAWNWVNEQLEQPAYMVQFINPTADDLGEKLSKIITQLHQDACLSTADNHTDSFNDQSTTTSIMDEKSSTRHLSTDIKRPNYCKRPHAKRA